MAGRLTFEEISQLNERKDELRKQHREYMRAHPELNHMLG